MGSPPIVGVILAGGLSRRLGGGDKCLLPLAGRPILAHAIERLRPQVELLILNANGNPARFDSFRLPVIADTVVHFPGPLAGILAGLHYAEALGARSVVTAAGDTPFLPRDLAARLFAAAGDGAAVARSRGRIHPVEGCFPVHAKADLEMVLRTSTNRRVVDWVAGLRAAVVDFDDAPAGYDPFFNVNQSGDLQDAEAIAAIAT